MSNINTHADLEGERRLLRSAYLPGGESIPLAQSSPILDKVVRLAGYKRSPGGLYQHYLNYFLGRAQEEAYAGQL